MDSHQVTIACEVTTPPSPARIIGQIPNLQDWWNIQNGRFCAIMVPEDKMETLPIRKTNWLAIVSIILDYLGVLLVNITAYHLPKKA